MGLKFEQFIPGDMRPGVRIRELRVAEVIDIPRWTKGGYDRLYSVKSAMRREHHRGKQFSIAVEEDQISVRRDQ